MWLMTNFGFFSVVQKKDDDELTIRARPRHDLEVLKERYIPNLGHIIKGGGTDYQYRAKVLREDMAEAARKIVMDIDYPNFKDSVAEKQGYKRAKVCGKVWEVLMELQW
jgi:hypothetical protein